MTSYMAIIVAFLMTIVGIVGNTWNPKRRGLHRLTSTGVIVLVLSIASLAVGISEIKQKDAEIRDVQRIRRIANDQVLVAVNYMLRHLLADHIQQLDDASLFARIKDPANLSAVGQDCLVSALGGQIADGYGGIGGYFDQPWQLIAFDVAHGKELLDDVIVKYGGFIRPELILLINDVLNDNFFLEKFGLNSDQVWLEEALSETKESISCSGWGTLGLY